jgi:hypothetical protein
MSSRRVSGLSLLLLCGVLVQPLTAQPRPEARAVDARARAAASVSGNRVAAVRRSAADSANRTRPTSTDGDTPRRVVVDTRGSELLVVRIGVPASMRWDQSDTTRRVQFRVLTSRHVQVVGNLTGAIDLARDSALVLALQLSRRAPAGRILAVTVEFTQGAATAQVAVDADVPVMRRISLSMPPQGFAVTRGRWSQLTFRVSNDGNIAEVPQVHLAAPSEWRTDIRPLEGGAKLSQPIASGTSRTMALRVWVPGNANQGTVMVPLSLVRPDSAPLVVQVPMDVLPDVAGSVAGPTLTTSYVAGQSGDAPTLQGYGMTLGGQLSDSLRIAGRFSYAGQTAAIGGAGFALARAGVITAPPSLDIEHPRVQLSAGATSGMLPELGGQFLAGLGGMARVRRGRIQARAFDLRPMSLQQQFSLVGHAAGRFSGGELAVDRGAARAAIFGASLNDPTTLRSLDVLGIRGGLGRTQGSSLATEFAYRSHAAGSGMGVATTARYAGARTSIDVRAMHAPGGSRAFARASDELMMSATRMFGRRSYFALGSWSQRDDNLIMGAAQNRGWYVTPTFSLWRSGNIGLEARGQSFSAGTAQGRIATEELAGGGSMNASIAGVQLTARSMLARLDRHLGVFDNVPFTSRQWRLDHMLLASRTGTRGGLSLAYMRQQYSGVSGVMPGQQSLSVRLDRYRPFLTRDLHVDAEWQRMQLGTGNIGNTIARAAVSIPLVSGMRIALGVERNPFMSLSTSRGRSPLLYSVRLDRSTVLPRLLSSAHGLVFRDENGNGERDRGERGVSGVVVVCGGARVATDAQGRYSCSQPRQEVDARTIPTGLVAARPRVENGEAIALRVVQPLRITLRVPTADSARISRSSLGQVAVSVRDSSGYAWRARALGDGRYVVDALPAGRYAVVVDASNAEEPLTLTGSAPSVEIGAHGTAPEVVLDVRPRPLRMRTFSPDAPGASPRPPELR